MLFVKINGRILDYEEYKRRIVLLKNFVTYSLRDTLVEYGFELSLDSFYNEEIDMEVEICFRKREKLEFV